MGELTVNDELYGATADPDDAEGTDALDVDTDHEVGQTIDLTDGAAEVEAEDVPALNEHGDPVPARTTHSDTTEVNQ